MLYVVLSEGRVEVLALCETASADGTVAAIGSAMPLPAGSRKHCYSLGVRRGTQWITVNLWNINQYGPFQRELFEEITHTLRFD